MVEQPLGRRRGCHGGRPAKLAIDWIGNDNIVFSTDYPHGDSKYPDAVTSFLELGIPDDAKRKILWDNCASLYNLQVAPASAGIGKETV